MEAYKKMRIEYNRLFDKLKENKITQKDFRDNAGISGATMQKLLHNGNITTEIICRICDYFQWNTLDFVASKCRSFML